MTVAPDKASEDPFDEAWYGIDQQVAADLGLEQWETPEAYRSKLMAQFFNAPATHGYDPGNSSDRRLLANLFRRQAFPRAKAYAEAALHALLLVPSRKLAEIRRQLRVDTPSKTQGKRPARLQKADARNLELLSFVVERIIPFAQFLKQRLDKNGKDVRLLPGHRGPKVAVPRQALAEEWNRSHPRWPMSSGDVLITQFYRAADRPHLRDQFIRQVRSEIDEEWEEQQRVLARLREASARLSDAERAKMAAPIDMEQAVGALLASPVGQAYIDSHHKLLEATRKLKARFPSEQEYQQWRAQRNAEREWEWRASLTRRDLVQERVRRLVWQLPDTPPEEAMERWQSPLRDWFLLEERDGRLRLHRWHWRHLLYDVADQFADGRYSQRHLEQALERRAMTRQASSQMPAGEHLPAPAKPPRPGRPALSACPPAPAAAREAKRTSRPRRPVKGR